MRSKALGGMYEELLRKQVDFDGFETRRVEMLYIQEEACCDYGVLRDTRGFPLTSERWEWIVAVARKHEVMVIVLPDVRTMRRYWYAERECDKLGPNDTVVCFVQEGVIETLLSASALAFRSLRQCFSYVQEDTAVLALEKTVNDLFEAGAAFKKDADKAQLLQANSEALRVYLKANGNSIAHLDEIEGYLGDAALKKNAGTLIQALSCIWVVRQK